MRPRGALSTTRLRRRLLASAILGAFTVLAIQSGTVMTVLGIALSDLGTSADVGPAMAVFLAASLVGMGAGGMLLRRVPAGRVAVASVVVTSAGLGVAASAVSLPVFVGARLAQGIGNGSCMVVLYVIAAAAFDGPGRARLLRAVSTAWMLPMIVSPILAGWFTDLVGWRAAFGATVVIGLIVAVVLAAATRGAVYGVGGASTWTLAAATVAGAAVCVLQLLPRSASFVSIVGGLTCLTVIGAAAYMILPHGTLGMRRGIPAGVALRGIVAGAFFGVEAWVPLMLIDDVGLSAWTAGAVVGLGGLCWVAGIRFPGIRWTRSGLSSPVRDLVVSCWIVAAGLVMLVLVSATVPSAITVALAWGTACYGMGSALPRISILVFEQSSPDRVAEVSLGLQSSDAIGCVVVVAVAGMCFAILSGENDTLAYAAVFGLGAVAAIGAALASSRIRETRLPSPASAC